MLGTAAVTAGIAIGASPKPRNRIANTSVSQRLATLTAKKDERFSFAPVQFQKDLARLSEPTKKALLANHNRTALQILSVNPEKDFAIAKFDTSNVKNSRWVNEHIGFSSIAGRTIETRIEQEGRLSDRWQVQFTIDKSLTRPTIRKLGQANLPKESVSSTRLIQKRITSMMLDHVQHLPPNATLVASAVESDGGGRGRTAIYRRYGFKSNPASELSEIETEVSISKFIKLAATRADASTETGARLARPRKQPFGTPLVP